MANHETGFSGKPEETAKEYNAANAESEDTQTVFLNNFIGHVPGGFIRGFDEDILDRPYIGYKEGKRSTAELFRDIDRILETLEIPAEKVEELQMLRANYLNPENPSYGDINGYDRVDQELESLVLPVFHILLEEGYDADDLVR